MQDSATPVTREGEAMKKNVALYAAAAILAAACASKETRQEAPVEDRSTAVTPPSGTTRPGTPTTSPTTPSAIVGNPLKDPNNILSKRSVYFDFDSNAVKDEYR